MGPTEIGEAGVAVMFIVTAIRAWIPRADQSIDGDRVFALVFVAALLYAVFTVGEPKGWGDLGLDPTAVRTAFSIAVLAIGTNVVLGRARRRIGSGPQA